MRLPTPEQLCVLEHPARVRVVRATPGSGKTWLVAELIRRELEGWDRAGGLAALSFTRVGGAEIGEAVGGNLAPPHFVGTIDAFLFRYVIRPFLSRVEASFAEPQLVPGEWIPESWKRYGPGQYQTATPHGLKVFGCVYLGEDDGGRPLVFSKPHSMLPLGRVSPTEEQKIWAAKMRVWKERGLLTHADAALWASRILGHPSLGAFVRGEVIRRFPFIIVDELQDTGHFLGKCVRALLDDPRCRGVLVGDPDQAIYEFTGARPDLFSGFESITGAVTLPLKNSRRCPPSVAGAASQLKDSGGAIGPNHDRSGRAILAHYADFLTDVPRLIDACRTVRSTHSVKVVARTTATVDELMGNRFNKAPSLHCRPLSLVLQAVVSFHAGRQRAAFASVSLALGIAIFDYEGVMGEDLHLLGVDPVDWNRLVVRCLLGASALPTEVSLFDWQQSVGTLMRQEVAELNEASQTTFEVGHLQPQRRPGWDSQIALFLPTAKGRQGGTIVPIQTVHAVKGETHDLTVFVCPEPSKSDRCPSTAWWSTDDQSREEKRIAYVAMTRTRRDLIICVSQSTYERLVKLRPGFVEKFECLSLDDCIDVLLGDAGAPSSSDTVATALQLELGI